MTTGWYQGNTLTVLADSSSGHHYGVLTGAGAPDVAATEPAAAGALASGAVAWGARLACWGACPTWMGAWAGAAAWGARLAC